jgi:iron complex transport system ATP-binding protein
MRDTLIETRHVTVRYGERTVLRDISLQFGSGELVAIAGPNGAGKSTLLGVISGLKTHFEGECLLWNKPVASWHRRELAKRLTLVPQSQSIDFPFSAKQIVAMGRAPFSDRMFESPEDERAVLEAMHLTGVTEFAHRDVRTLSGGERQRVILASALAQQPEALLLDEPTTYLDLRHQVEIYELVARLCADGLLALCVTHDLNLAAAYASRIVLLKDGQVVEDGDPHDVLQSSILSKVFETRLRVEHTDSGRPFVRLG